MVNTPLEMVSLPMLTSFVPVEDRGDLLAVLVLDQLHGNGGMGVAVKHGVDAGGVGDQVGRAPRLGGFVNAQMCNGDNVGRAVLLGSVNGFLHLVIKVSALVALREGVDEIAVGVLEVGRGGLGEGFRAYRCRRTRP